MSDIRIENMNFEKMDFNDIRLALKQAYRDNQALRDEIALMKRYYDDLIYNIDVENMNNRTKTTVKKSEEAYEKAATVEIKAEEISMAVKATWGKPVTVDKFDSDTAQKDVVYYEESTNTYYYYDSLLQQWNESENATFGTVFTQTATGFELNGNVEISGNLITEGTIKGVDIVGVKYWDAGQNGYIYLNSLPGTCDFELRNNKNQAIFTVYDTHDGTQLEAYDFTFLRATPGELVVPYGTWNFAYCDVKNLDAVAKFA